MKKLLSLLLLTPVLTLAQELPNEDWVCVTSHRQRTSLFPNEKYLYNSSNDYLPIFMFNPSRGFRILLENSLEKPSYGSESCSAYTSISGTGIFACTNAYRAFAETFQIDQQDGEFIHVISTVSTLGESVELYMGSCTKE